LTQIESLKNEMPQIRAALELRYNGLNN
jgi:hypothetical protein